MIQKHDEWRKQYKASIVKLVSSRPMTVKELATLVDVPPEMVHRKLAKIKKRYQRRCVTAEEAKSKILSSTCRNMVDSGLLVVVDKLAGNGKAAFVYGLADTQKAKLMLQSLD